MGSQKTTIILVGASILDNDDKVGKEHCVQVLLQKKGYEVHNFSYRGFAAKDILEGGFDSRMEYHTPLEEIERLNETVDWQHCVFILQAGGGNDLLKAQLRVAMRVESVIEQLSNYSCKIIVNNRYPLWPDKLLHRIANFYIAVVFECVWNGIMQQKKLVLANLKDYFPNQADVLDDGLHLNKESVQRQVDLYHHIIQNSEDWNKCRTSFPERRSSCIGTVFVMPAAWCCCLPGAARRCFQTIYEKYIFTKTDDLAKTSACTSSDETLPRVSSRSEPAMRERN